jgi:hypothetical protein
MSSTFGRLQAVLELEGAAATEGRRKPLWRSALTLRRLSPVVAAHDPSPPTGNAETASACLSKGEDASSSTDSSSFSWQKHSKHYRFWCNYLCSLFWAFKDKHAACLIRRSMEREGAVEVRRVELDGSVLPSGD